MNEKRPIDKGIVNRMNQVRYHKNLSYEAIAIDCEMSTTSLYGILGAHTAPSVVFLKRFCETYSVSIEWLVMGIGSEEAHYETKDCS